MSQPIILNERMLSALEELGRYEDRNSDQLMHSRAFWWREASMKQLAALGLTEAYVPSFVKKSVAYRLTEAGKEHLRGLPK